MDEDVMSEPFVPQDKLKLRPLRVQGKAHRPKPVPQKARSDPLAKAKADRLKTAHQRHTG